MMEDIISVEQYRNLKPTARPTKVRTEGIPTTTQQQEESNIRFALRTMGHYFELPEKEVNFFIRQMELSKKI